MTFSLEGEQCVEVYCTSHNCHWLQELDSENVSMAMAEIERASTLKWRPTLSKSSSSRTLTSKSYRQSGTFRFNQRTHIAQEYAFSVSLVNGGVCSFSRTTLDLNAWTLVWCGDLKSIARCWMNCELSCAVSRPTMAWNTQAFKALIEAVNKERRRR